MPSTGLEFLNAFASRLRRIAAAMGSFLAEVKATRALLSAMQGKPGEAKLKSAQAARLLEIANSLPVAADDCPSVMEEIAQCMFDDAAADGLMSAVAKHVGGEVGGVRGQRAKLQNFSCLANYFLEEQWSAMRTTPQKEDPLRTLMCHAAQLGLRYPTEGTWQYIAAVYLLVQNEPEAITAMTPAAKHEVLKHVKRAGRRFLTPGMVDVPVLPASPQEYRRLYPSQFQSVFGTMQPSGQPFGMALAMIAGSICMRVSGAPMNAPVLPCARGQGDAASQCQQMLMKCMMAMIGQGQGDGVLPGFQVFGKASSSSQSRVAMGSSPQNPLPLESTPTPESRPSVLAATRAVRLALGGSAAARPEPKQESQEQEEWEDQQTEEDPQDAAECNDEGEDERKKRDPVKKRPAAALSSPPLSVMKRPASNKCSRICMEETRSQVRCRSGDGSSFAIPWGMRSGQHMGSRAAAIQKAEKWLQEQ